MNSIRKKLLFWLLAGQLLTVAIAGSVIFFYVRSELEALFDDRLRQMAYSLPSKGEYVPDKALLRRSLEDDDNDFVIQVWQADGNPLVQLNLAEGKPGLGAEGFSSHWSDGIYWRSFVVRRGDRLVQVSQPFSTRLEMSTGVALGAIAPVVVLVVILGVLVWVSVKVGLRPLREVADALGRRRPSSLAPVGTNGLPDELVPLVLALNDLLKRLGKALDGQRKFIADAAHELRTPLAAVQLQTQLLMRSVSNEERSQAAMQIRAGTARASHLVAQLLTLARMEPDEWQRPLTEVDLSTLMRSVVIEHAAMAQSREIDLGVSQDEPVFLVGDAESLRVMFSNLVDNAIRYTPNHGQVDVSLKMIGTLAVFEVQDNGKGIPEADRDQVFDRFYRRPGTREQGSGLGLAIVQEVVTRHGGEVLLMDGDQGTGLKVVVNLPLEHDRTSEQDLYPGQSA